MIAIVRYASKTARVLCGLLFAAGSCVAQQSSSTVGPASLKTAVPAKLTPKKIWTNENIAEVRSPGDLYQDKKESASKQASQTAPSDPPPDLTIPSTQEGIDEAINTRKGWLDDCKAQLENTRQRLAAADHPVLRKTLEDKASLIEQDIATISREIQALEKAKSAQHAR